MCDDFAAHRVTDQHRLLQPQRAHHVAQIEDEVSEAVAGGCLAVAVTAQVECQHVVAIRQATREVVEGMRVIAQAMDENERPRAGVAPIAEVDA